MKHPKKSSRHNNDEEKKMLETLKGLLHKKNEMLKDMFEHTLNISTALEKNDIEQVLMILRLRQQEMEIIDEIDKKILSSFAGDFTVLWENIKNDEELKIIYSEIQSILKKIKAQDDENMEKARKEKLKLSDDIKSVRHTGQAMRGYGVIDGRSPNFGAFIDTKK
jgi:hypothetical protein